MTDKTWKKKIQSAKIFYSYACAPITLMLGRKIVLKEHYKKKASIQIL